MAARRTVRRSEWFWFAAVLAALAVPRIARILYPQVWIEDESYLNGAFLLSRGLAPYRDFALPHFPLLEALLGLVFTVAPAAIRTAEIVTAIAAFSGSVLVYLIAERVSGRGSAVAAAAIFATSSLLFRYHLFEREVFDIVPILAAVWIVSGPDVKPRANAGDRSRDATRGGREITPVNPARGAAGPAAGLLLGLAMAIKLTASAALIATVAELLVNDRRRDAAIVGSTAIGAVALATAALFVLFGRDFVVQVIVFRAVHASFPSLGVKLDELRYTLDVALAAGLGGIAFIAWTGRVRQFAVPLLQVASGFVFLVLLNPTYWAHTGIELLPWLAMCGGAFFATAPARARSNANGPGAKRLVCAAAAVLLAAFVAPIRNLNWEAGDGSVYGWGYRDREEIAAAATIVRARTSDRDAVATPPIIAFAANRRELVPYAELAGDIADLSDAVRREGYVAAITASPLRGRSFWEGVESSRERIAPIVDEAVRRRRLAVVINYSEADLFPIPLVDVEQHALEAAGYDLASITAHYDIWVRRASPATARRPSGQTDRARQTALRTHMTGVVVP